MPTAGRRFKMAPRALRHKQRNYYFYRKKPENLRIFWLSLFTGGDWTANGRGRARSPLGELPPQRLRGLKSAEHKKSFSEAAWIFCMEPIFFGIIKGEQPLIRASRASKVAGAFLVLFWHAKENIPGGDAFCKRHQTLNTRLRSVREASPVL